MAIEYTEYANRQRDVKTTECVACGAPIGENESIGVHLATECPNQGDL